MTPSAHTAVGHGTISSSASVEADVVLSGIRKTYGDVVAVDGVDLEIARRRVLHHARAVRLGQDDDAADDRRLRAPRRGQRSQLGGEDVTGRPPYDARREHGLPGLRALPAHDRGRERRYGLRVKGVEARASAGARVDEALETRPARRASATASRSQLSGGQRQRVALARAIVNRPQVLLLDEPLGALDLKLRQEMQSELKRIQQELGITFIYVTHDQEEALTMSDRIAVFNQGRIEQIGTPAEVYERPATEFVAGFVGTSNILERDGRRFTIRPEKIRHAATASAPSRRARRAGTIRDVVYVGMVTRYVVDARRAAASSSSSAEPRDVARAGRRAGTAGRGAPGIGVRAPSKSTTRTGGGDMTKQCKRPLRRAGARGCRARGSGAAGSRRRPSGGRRHAEHDRVGGLHSSRSG